MRKVIVRYVVERKVPDTEEAIERAMEEIACEVENDAEEGLIQDQCFVIQRAKKSPRRT